jgi:hypothetical protein
MSASDYTDIFARFADQLAAETLADYIASLDIPCELVELSALAAEPLPSRYGLRVPRAWIDSLKEALNLTPVAKYRDLVSPQVTAGRLAREKIPCYLGGTSVGPDPLFLKLGYSGVPIDDTGKLGPGTLAVPASFVAKAQRVLAQKISEDELAKLALSYDFNPKDPP